MPQKQILLVDDSKSARFVLLALLQKKGYAVATAESAENALEMLRESKPDAIFMDHMMPGMDGFQATQTIKGDPSTAHIPVIMCTSNDQAEYVQKAKRIGSVGILPKPPTTEKLSEILDALDQEVASAPVASAIKESVAYSSANPEEIKTALETILPTVIRETIEPLIEKKLSTLSEKLKLEIPRQNTDTDLSTIQQVVSASTANLREEILREASVQSEFLNQENEKLALHNVDERLKAISTQFHRDLENEVSTLASRLSDDRAFIAPIQAAITASAESRAIAVSQAQAESTAKDTAERIALTGLSETTLAFTSRFQALSRKINLLAIGAALVGVISAAVVYFLPSG